MKEADHPLGTQDIFEHLGEKGHELSGKDPKNTLAARLSNSKSLTYHRDMGGMVANRFAGSNALLARYNRSRLEFGSGYFRI